MGQTTSTRLQGNFAPVQRELIVSGLIPHGDPLNGLNGTLYRNGPNPHFPRPDSHWFTGDGMLHAITLRDGAVSYRNRWVRTPKFLAEEQAGRALYGSFAGKLPDTPAGTQDDAGSANTNIVWHAGRLLALEEAHPPTEIDPTNLGTRGYAVQEMGDGPFTAHPKIDPVTGELLFFGYNASGPFSPTINYGVLDAAGTLRRHDQFEAPYASMVHDFVATERHVLFPILPLTGSMERAKAGKPPYAWEPDKGAYVGVMRRDGSTAGIRWFQGAANYVFHIMNAWEEGEKIIADVMAFEEAPLFPHADGSPGDPAKQRARLTRWTFDLVAGTNRFQATQRDDLTGEFPRIDDRRAGSSYRHGWFAGTSAPAFREGFDSLVHIDATTSRRQIFALSAGDGVSEPVFAPRGANEGDGWLLAVVWRAAEARSELLVFEALDIARGPIATVGLPQRVPFGFHGNWVSEEQVA